MSEPQSPYIERIQMQCEGYVAHNGLSSLGPFRSISELFEAIKRAGWEKEFIRAVPRYNTTQIIA